MLQDFEDADHDALAPPIGTVLEGRYELVEHLGEGGVGWVYRAIHLRLRTEVAIKMLQAPYDNHESLRPRFEREARALAALRHPNIVTLTDYSVADGRPYLVMELLEGQTLADRLEDGPIAEDRARRIVRQVLDALIYAHGRGFAHRDLKPSNIFLVELPTDPDHVKILDFGFVKLMGASEAKGMDLTRSGMAFGTPAYMCPEQATGGRTDPRADLYAMGVVLFEMLAGRRPFVGEVPDVIRAHLTDPVPPLSVGGLPIEATPELRTFFDLALAKLPEERFETARAMREALDALPTPLSRPLGDTASETMPPPEPIAPTTLRPPKSRSRVPLLLAAITAVLLPLIAGLIAAWAALDADPEPQARIERPANAIVREQAAEIAPPERLPERLPEGEEPPPAEEPAPIIPEPFAQTEAEPAGPEPALPPPAEPPAAEPAPHPFFGPSSDDPWTVLPTVPELLESRATVLGGQPLAGPQQSAMRTFARAHEADPRPHLVLAQHYFVREQEASAVEHYERAFRADPRSRHDPRMLADLLTLASHAPAWRRASNLVVEAYGRSALLEVERRVRSGDLDRRGRERLRDLAVRLRSAPP